jgi:hypothetical protein
MNTRRFGRKLKLPSSVAIKYAILRMMVQDEQKAQAPAAPVVAHGRGTAETLKRPSRLRAEPSSVYLNE